MATEVEETLKRLVSHKAVIGTIVVNYDGIPIKSTMDPHVTTQYSGELQPTADIYLQYLWKRRFLLAGLLNQLVDQAKAMFKEIDASNDLTFLRLRTRKHEIMVAPDRDYLLIVVQNTMDI